MGEGVGEVLGGDVGDVGEALGEALGAFVGFDVTQYSEISLLSIVFL